jgi:uncharacterized membrane protein
VPFAVLDRLFGLPGHPLLVHVPIALVPIASAGLVAISVSPEWRRRSGWWVVALAFVSLISVQLAMSSGESLQEHVGERSLVQRHAELADPLRILAFGTFVAAAGIVVIERRRAHAPLGRSAQAAVVAGSIGLALLSAFQLAEVGHSGAKAVWHGTPTSGPSSPDGRDVDRN